MMILAMNSLKELKQITNHEGLKKYGFLNLSRESCRSCQAQCSDNVKSTVNLSQHFGHFEETNFYLCKFTFFMNRFNDIVTWDDMESELNWIYSETEKFQMPVCLCHNDLWHANILYDEKNGRLEVITDREGTFLKRKNFFNRTNR